MIFLIAIYCVTHLVGLIVLMDSQFNISYGDWPITLPKHIYRDVRVNWFGATLLYLLYFITTPLFAIGTIIYWLCTFGRK